jgi:cytochrome P450
MATSHDESAASHNEPVNEELGFDPLDMSRTKDWELLRRIRQEAPVMRPTKGVVFTARHADSARVFKDAKGFSSAGDMRAPGVVVAEEESFLGELDPPLHPKIRRVLHRFFTPQNAYDAEPWTRASVRRRLETVKAKGGGDLMAELAIPLPGSVAAHALGIPDDRHDQVMDWCNELLHSTWPYTGQTDKGVGLEACFPEMVSQIDEWIHERQDPSYEQPDLFAMMVRFRDDDGWQIDPRHIRALAINVLAGSLSASYMIGNLWYRLLTDEEHFASVLRADASKIPVAVEESLRFEAPVTFLMRSSKGDTEIGGCPVHKGEHVMMGIASAGRDETVYDDANEFRLDRVDPVEHLAFGAGPHLCIGNHLTRMVGKVVLEETIAVFPPGRISLAPGYHWECVAHVQEFGPETLDVVTSA